MDTELSTKGYKLALKTIPPHFLENIRRELNVKPLENPNFPTKDQAFPVYRLSKTSVYLPRFYGIEKYNKPKTVTVPPGETIALTFNGTLRDIQEQTITATLKTFEEHGGGVISLDTGLGKTVVALKLIELMKVKTIIVVHAEFLLEQWVSRIKQFLPDARIGIIRQERCEIEDVDITVAMIQTVINRDYPTAFFDNFGMIQIDECLPFHQYISTENGMMKIGELYNSWNNGNVLPQVLSYNDKTFQFEYKTITYAWKRQNYQLLRIYYFDIFFECTENHLVLLYSGQYTEAKNLKINDKIMSNCDYITITSIYKIKNIIGDVYDIEVEDNHNFICCDVNCKIGPVVHNCHHIAAKSFSSLFYKVQTKYMVGLSATPERKDGLSKVLYWFLGPQIITIKRETNKPSIKFIFNETTGYIEEFNKLGKINNPTMITNLTKQQPRNEMIIKTIKSFPERKILVLSVRREHCENILNLLKHHNVSAGLYLGGMSTINREETTNCRVIIGTYQASGEGFDVPELDTLILATPKSDVEQAVGRILRQKNPNEPLVIDIVDQFSIFNGQYYKRRKFYKNNQFEMK